MGTRLSSSRLYAHLWGTPETDALFEERAMIQRWLDILAALATAQASLGIVPDAAARAIAASARVDALDLDFVAEQTRRLDGAVDHAEAPGALLPEPAGGLAPPPGGDDPLLWAPS